MSTMTDETATHLYVSAVDVKPVEVESWSDMYGEDMDGFTYYEPFTYELGDTEYELIASNGSTVAAKINGTVYTDWDAYEADWEDEHPDTEPPVTESDWDALMAAEPYMWGSEGPMMNYYYPVPGLDADPEVAANLADLPLCVVEVNGVTGLALTGGGMDLSWDICKAFIRLGYLPPVHFADLPKYAGMTYDREVIAAMRQALEVQLGWVQRSLERLGEFDS